MAVRNMFMGSVMTSLSKIMTIKKIFGQVYENDNVTHAEAIRFTKSQAWADMIQDVSDRTGVEVSWNNS